MVITQDREPPPRIIDVLGGEEVRRSGRAHRQLACQNSMQVCHAVAGMTFRFPRNTLSGSQVRFRSASQLYESPNTDLIRSGGAVLTMLPTVIPVPQAVPRTSAV